MRNMTFARKDFAAVHAMPADAKEAIRLACAAKCKQLGLRPTRGDKIKFEDDDLFIVSRDDAGNVVAKQPISHTCNVADLLRYIENVAIEHEEDGTQTDMSAEACRNLQKLYVVAC